MDLPTYTNIWRIEKRLYKLYDFRLPMPLPVGQIAVFALITVPYIVALTVLGLPFSHSLVWLYLLPPGALTWLATRPVLENKRLPELAGSQARYLGEPRVWCRLTPLAEKDVIAVTGRVWRRTGQAARARLADDRQEAARDLRALRAAQRRTAAQPSGVAAAAAGQAVRDHAERGQAERGQAVRSQAVRGQAVHGAPASTDRSRPTRSPGAGAASSPPARPGPLRERYRVRDSSDGLAAGLWATSQAEAGEHQHGGGSRESSSGWPELGTTAWSRPESNGWPDAGGRADGGHTEFSGSPGSPERGGGRQASIGWPDAAHPAGASRTGQPSRTSQPSRTDQPSRTGQPSQRSSRWPEAGGWPEARSAQPEHAGPRAAAQSGPVGPARAAQSGPASPARHEPPPVRERRPAVTLSGETERRAMPSPVEQALAGPVTRQSALRDDRVLIVPGGHRPGTPDQRQRDRNRAQLPISGTRLIVVLGCTVGAGQTVTALMAGEILASLRTDLVAVFDLNPGAASLSTRARVRPALSQAASLSPSRLEVLSCADGAITDNAIPGGVIPGGVIPGGVFPDVMSDWSDGPGAADGPDPGAALDAGQMFERAASRYLLALADPSAAVLPRLLAVADQLLLVAPASAAAAGAIAMTFEWLEAHNQGALARSAIMVMNGVSRHTMPQVARAEQVAKGQCRAIIRVPWDDQLKINSPQSGQLPAPAVQAGQHWAGLLSQASVTAYTALAGVLVAGLAGAPGRPAGSGLADL